MTGSAKKDSLTTKHPAGSDARMDSDPHSLSTPGETVLSARGISVTFTEGMAEDRQGEGLRALQSVNLNLYAQEFVCLLGPSGSGKSTLLRVLAGLLHPTAGEVRFHSLKPRISLVFQDANLMPWRTVIENITLPLDLQKITPEEANRRAMEWINRVGLKGFENAWPRDLSGGMAQRVAIARALIQEPDLLLLDEPFGALDALTREKMGAELLNLWQSQRPTVFMVTHSISEAILLSDRVLVLAPRPGRIEMELPINLPRPRSEEIRYTAEFGYMARRIKAAIH